MMRSIAGESLLKSLRWHAFRWHPRSWRLSAPAGRAQIIRRGRGPQRRVGLTFDVGFSQAHASNVLDVLDEFDAPGTFGITGRWAENHPTLIVRVVRSGHQIVNHTYDHLSFTGAATGTQPLSFHQRKQQLELAEFTVREAAGATMRPWFRPPYGDFDPSVNADIASLGYGYNVLWTIDSLGWRDATPDRITERCLRCVRPGAIYVFHVDSTADAEALPMILHGLRKRGYSTATVADLILV